MTLRARLTVFFAGIVIVPLIAAIAAFHVIVGRQLERRNDEQLQRASQAARVLWQDRLDVAAREVTRVSRQVVALVGEPDTQLELDRARDVAGLDFLAVTAADGTVVAASIGPANFPEELSTPTAEELLEPSGPALRSSVDVLSEKERETNTVTGGFFADEALAHRLARASRLGVAFISGGRVVASTVTPYPPLPSGSRGLVDLPDGRRAEVLPIEGWEGGIATIAPPVETFGVELWLIALFALPVATGLGYALARLISRPLQRLAKGAQAVAAGHLDTRVDLEGQGDMGTLANAFNSMTENLRGYVGELNKSRDELRRGLDRLGATLRSTHDLEGMLGVVLETAAVTLSARGGAVYLLSPSGREIRLEVARGYPAPARASLRLGTGIAGRAGAGISVLMPSDEDPVVPSSPVEPGVPTAVAVPLIRGDRTMGVLALYGRTIPEPFIPDDVSTLQSFAGQASVAIENVLLHQEAQRLSITDGLTGVWNRRYLQLTLTKEIERSQRFSRPLSVLLIDIDHFKEVNDAHGHQVGDEVLVEITRRMMGSIRSQIDSLARYGGEEFVVVLPETPRDGALVVASKILSTIRHRAFVEDGTDGIPITVSIGAASFPDDGGSAEELIHAADLAMYRAKEAGRDRVEASVPD